MTLIKKQLVYGGVEKNEFEEVRYALNLKDRNILIFAGATCSLLFFGMFLSTFAGTSSDFLEALRLRSRYIYFLLMLVCIGISLVSGHISPKKNLLTLLTCYSFLTVLFIFAIWCGTFNQPQYPSITFCVFLVALPCLIIDRPYRINLYLICVCAIYLLCSWYSKATDIFYLDLMNCICFYYLGVAIGLLTQNLRIREAVQKNLVEKQRDMDQLSGLLDKSAFERNICRSIREKRQGAFIIMDIDDFKSINDTYGHVYGDAVIRMVADCIRKAFPAPAVTGRFGGDEFVIYISEDTDRTDISGRVRTFQDLIRETVELPGRNASVTVSIGIRILTDGDNDYTKILDSTDKALYLSKHLGKNRYSFSSDI